MQQKINNLLKSVRNPFRYAGGEAGSRPKVWDDAKVRFCLAFPDTYEIGMSHLGLSILYHIINDRADLLAERAFAPWADMEEELQKRGMSLFSLETYRPLKDFDIIGFSLSYELSYTNVLNMLSLSGIPLRAKDRDDSHALVIAGGPCTFNPMPVAPFFDAIVIGDGENVVLQIADVVKNAKAEKLPRKILLENLFRLEGVYVPSLCHSSEGGNLTFEKPLRATISDLNSAQYPTNPITPYKATQERMAVEVARGCTRGCRFCQAGYIYRPLRQRSGENAAAIASKGLCETGNDEFSFLSLSIGDWAPLEGALNSVHENLEGMPVNATLPSLRVESLTQNVAKALGTARAGSFTFAPEAGTERMRMFINKGNKDEDLYASVEKIFQLDFHAIKLYFMIGFPGETEEDIEGIVRISNKCLDIGKKFHRRPEVTVSTSTFVPKAHTPLQWERQLSIDEAITIQRKLKAKLRRPGLFYRWHDAKISFLEGVFSRGGDELAAVIESAFKKGARFDGWDECFSFDRWSEAFKENDIVPEKYLGERDSNSKFPWEFLGVGPSREFLVRERASAHELLSTPDCSRDKCVACGVCDFKEIKNNVAEDFKTASCSKETLSPLKNASSPGKTCGSTVDSPVRPGNDGPLLPGNEKPLRIPYRLRYSKTGRASFLGMIETLDALRRGLRAAGLPLCYTEGYHPRARISSGPALSVGLESMAEFVDVEISRELDFSEVFGRLKTKLPEGLDVCGAALLLPGYKSIEDSIDLSFYEAIFAPSEGDFDIKSAISRFNDAGRFSFLRMRGEKSLDVDLKAYVTELAVLADNVVRIGALNEKPAIKITEIVSAIFGCEAELIRKVEVRFK